MALQKQAITIPLLGLDTHSDPKSAPPGSAELAENVMYRRATGGGVESRKRLGTTSRTRFVHGAGAPSITDGRKLAELNNEQLLVTANRLYSYAGGDGVFQPDGYVDKGDLSPIGLSAEPVASGYFVRTCPDMAFSGHLACQVTVVASFARVTVIDVTTGVHVLQDFPTGMAAAGGARVVGNIFGFLLIAYNAGTLRTALINSSSPTTVSAPAVLAANGSVATPRWTAAQKGTSTQTMIAYNGAAANQLRGVLVDSTGASVATFLAGEQPDGALEFLHHDYADNNAYLAYIDSTRGTKVMTIALPGYTVSGAVVLDAAQTTGRNITGWRLAGANTVFAEVAGAATYLNKIIRSTGGAFTDWQLGHGLWSRVFKYGTQYFFTAVYADGLQDKYFIFEASGTAAHVAGQRLIGQAFDGLGQGVTSLPSFLGAVPSLSATVFAVPVTKFEAELSDLLSGATDIYSGQYLRIDFAPTLGAPKQIGDSLLLPGGIVRVYDGETTSELGFTVFPKLYGATQGSIGGTHLTLLGTYSITATYVFLDGKGQVYESAPADPITVTLTGANNQITVFYTNLRATDKVATFVKFYITENREDVFTAARTVLSVYADGTSVDFNVEPGTGDEIYTTGRALPHNAFPPAKLIEVWRDRAFFAQTDVPNRLWVSDEIEEDAGISVSQANVLPLPSDDGEVTSLNEFDDRVVIGKASALYQLSGSGPAANGDGQYQSPSRINSVVGPTSQRGAIKTSNGLVFKSAHGLYLLPRGAADPVRLLNVEGYDSLTLMGASNVDGYEQTRFVTAEGRSLFYHYGLADERGIGRWSTATGQAAVDCGNFGGAWCYLSSDGVVHVEVAGQWADDGVAYTRNERLTWLTAGGLFGNIRLYAAEMLGEVLASCTLTTTVAYDSDATVVDTMTKAVTVATKGALELRPTRGRSDAVQFAISETSTGEGYRLTAIGLEIGAKPGFSAQVAGAFLA